MRIIAGSDLLLNLHVRAYSAHACAQTWKGYGRNGKRIVLRRVPKAASAQRGTAARARPARAPAPPQGISHQGSNHAVCKNDYEFRETPKTKNISTCIMSKHGHRGAAVARGAAQSAGTQLRHKGTGCTRVSRAACPCIAPCECACTPPSSYPFAQGVRALQPAVLGRVACLIWTPYDIKCDKNGEIMRYRM